MFESHNRIENIARKMLLHRNLSINFHYFTRVVYIRLVNLSMYRIKGKSNTNTLPNYPYRIHTSWEGSLLFVKTVYIRSVNSINNKTTKRKRNNFVTQLSARDVYIRPIINQITKAYIYDRITICTRKHFYHWQIFSPSLCIAILKLSII